MTKLIQYALVLFSLFLTSLVVANYRVVGHMPPLDKEKLATPINLRCGLTIHEWRGSNIDRAKAEKICDIAVASFVPYLKTKNLAPDHNEPFEWPAALVPDGTCYRCLNDVQYRFRYRPYRGYTTGYTSYTQNWLFMISNPRRSDFAVTLAHELFHAMSDYYGILDSYPTDEQIEQNEVLAMGFTEYLGLGR